jgi:antitoxin CptB
VNPDAPDLRRLRWRCRRGLLELDLILGNFLDCGYGKLTTGERVIFDRLLSLPDPVLLAYIQGQETPASGFKEIVRKII